MIKTLVVENFKAIKYLKIAFTPFTVLIGGNSCGKSTILQALDFMRAFTTRDIDEYLHERGWAFDDLNTQFSKKGIGIGVGLSLLVNGKPQNIAYTFTVDNSTRRIITTERIQNMDENKILVLRGIDESSVPENMDKFYLKSSFLKLIDENNPSDEYPAELYAVKKFFAQSSSYELLNPDRMREKGSRGEVKNIGMGGEKLAAYINKMSDSQRNKMNKILSGFIGYVAKTTTEMQWPGWVELFLNENFSEALTKIKAAHISDGLLRLIALIAASLPEKKARQRLLPNMVVNIPDSGFILFDEIEDGINLNLIEKVINMLRKTGDELNKQVIVTTHSPVIADSLKPEEIIYMWRGNDGQIQAKPMFSTEQMRRPLRALSPGEVWINYDKSEILERLSTGMEAQPR